ncbi:MAG: leucine-rich repeat protein [Bacteroidales bacterium]|nr:leucine-rich repeat protein [Bacteroidales bacterium]
MGTSILHIKTEVECKVFLFDEEKGIATPGKYFNLEVRKGEQDLRFVSTLNSQSLFHTIYVIEDNDCDYQLFIKQSNFTESIQIPTTPKVLDINLDEPSDDELSDGIEDKYGVIYSKDGSQLLKCNNDKIEKCIVKDGCKTIRSFAFASCHDMTCITYPSSLTYISDSAFEWCWNLTSVSFPSNLKYIGKSAFYSCEKLASIAFTDGLTYIGERAFGSCEQLNGITLPDSIIYIGPQAFSCCSNLKNIVFPSRITKIAEELCSSCYNLDNVILPNSIMVIEKNAFETCSHLSNIILSTNLTRIEEGAFSCCNHLFEIELPEDLQFIGDKVFFGCNKLKSINIPFSVQHIGESAFASTSINEVKCDSDQYAFDNGCLIDIKAHKLIAFLSDKKEILIPEGITHIGCGAFMERKNLTCVTLPNTLRYIGFEAFGWCNNLYKIKFPKSLQVIENGAFRVCERLWEVEFANGLTQIGDEAFELCTILYRVSLPSSLTYFGEKVFNHCDCLSDINIPQNTKSYFEELLPPDLHSKLNEGVPFINNIIEEYEPIIKPYYLFFDTETTGVPQDYNAPASDTKNWPRLVQLGWILTDESGNEISSGNEIVKPDGFVIPSEASCVHGITTEVALRDGKPLKQVIEAFIKDTNGIKFFVGHNVSFDQKVVGAELYRLGIADTISTARSLDTMKAATDYCKIPGSYGYKWPKLIELHRKLFGCDFEDAHDAMADITATKKCFFEMKRRNLI